MDLHSKYILFLSLFCVIVGLGLLIDVLIRKRKKTYVPYRGDTYIEIFSILLLLGGVFTFIFNYTRFSSSA